jgi:hypothetical protein
VPNNILTALLYTEIIEVVVGFLLGFRDKKSILAIVFINLITNPILNYILWLNNYYSFLRINTKVIILFEIIIVFIEWRLLLFALRRNSGKLLILSILMNLCSFLLGSAIQVLGGTIIDPFPV